MRGKMWTAKENPDSERTFRWLNNGLSTHFSQADLDHEEQGLGAALGLYNENVPHPIFREEIIRGRVGELVE